MKFIFIEISKISLHLKVFPKLLREFLRCHPQQNPENLKMELDRLTILENGRRANRSNMRFQ
jgi:hypothetical protein